MINNSTIDHLKTKIWAKPWYYSVKIVHTQHYQDFAYILVSEWSLYDCYHLVKIVVVPVTAYMEREEASPLLFFHCNLLWADSPVFKLKF